MVVKSPVYLVERRKTIVSDEKPQVPEEPQQTALEEPQEVACEDSQAPQPEASQETPLEESEETPVEVEETGPVERKLRVEIPTADVDAAFDEAYRKLGRSTRVTVATPTPRSITAAIWWSG